MNTNRSVRVKDIVEKFQMEVINKGTDYDTEILTITDVNRPGLQFIGFFDYFDPRRLQIIGKSEVTFLRCLTVISSYPIVFISNSIQNIA